MPFSKNDLILKNNSLFFNHFNHLFFYFNQRHFDALPIKFDEQIITLKSRCFGFDLYFKTIQNADFYANQRLWIDLQYFKKNDQYFLYISKVYHSISEDIQHLAIKKTDHAHSSLLQCIEKIAYPPINLLDDFNFKKDVNQLEHNVTTIIHHETSKS